MTQINPIIPLSESEAKNNTRIKFYGDKVKLQMFSVKVFNPLKHELVSPVKRMNKPRQSFKDVESRNDNLKRTKDKAYDIAMANEFHYFVTFTLDEKKIDRYDKEVILKKFKTWLRHKVERNEFKYIIFPEYHKDGAIHFHGLCSGNIKLEDSGKRSRAGQIIYNSDSWPFGFSSVIILGGSYGRVVNYITKYISKDNQKIFGKYYFAGGRGLKREVPTLYMDHQWNEIEGKVYHIPEAGISVKYASFDVNNDN